MAGSKQQATSTKLNNGEDFYAKIGAKGGATKTEKTKLRGFANPNHPYHTRKRG